MDDVRMMNVYGDCRNMSIIRSAMLWVVMKHVEHGVPKSGFWPAVVVANY